MSDIFYIDCEFDGHNGDLLSVSMVRDDGYSLHVQVNIECQNPWVIENVLPIMQLHNADMSYVAEPNEVGNILCDFLARSTTTPTIIADSPVDIGRFCRAISTGEDGEWRSTEFQQMIFGVRNIDCYPTTLAGAVQHNAWWDAMALRAALDPKP